MPDPFPYRRILLYGVTGSGKTTLGAKLSVVTGLPWHEVDQLTWEPGWIQVPDDEQERRIAEICGNEKWILDTAYGKWVQIPLGRAELIVGLDYPRWRSLSQLARRTLTRMVDKKPICNGNVETLKGLLSSDGIITWHFKSFKRKQQRMRAWARQESGPKVLLFKSPRELDIWLKSLGPRIH